MGTELRIFGIYICNKLMVSRSKWIGTAKRKASRLMKRQGASSKGDGVFKMGKEVHAPLILKTIEVIQALKLPCQNTESEFEFLCDDCPYDIAPENDCGLALLHDKARIIKLELE